MNKILFFLLSILLFSFTVLEADKDDIIAALQNGNTDEFVKYFDNSIDVKLPNSNEMKSVSKAQAGSAVKSFFASDNITSCSDIKQRESGGTMYVTGKLNGTNSYNITVMIKSSGDKFSVITLRVNN